MLLPVTLDQVVTLLGELAVLATALTGLVRALRAPADRSKRRRR